MMYSLYATRASISITAYFVNILACHDVSAVMRLTHATRALQDITVTRVSCSVHRSVKVVDVIRKQELVRHGTKTIVQLANMVRVV